MLYETYCETETKYCGICIYDFEKDDHLCIECYNGYYANRFIGNC